MAKKSIVTCKDYGKVKFDPNVVTYALDYRFCNFDSLKRRVTMKLFRRPGRYRLVQGTIEFQTSPCPYSRCNYTEGFVFVPTSRAAAFREEEARRANTLCSCTLYPQRD